MAQREYLIPDGRKRTLQEEHDLNLLFAKVFSGEQGKRALDYLRSITMHAVMPQDVESRQLHDQEGMRRLMQIIQTRVDHGRAGQPNPERKHD